MPIRLIVIMFVAAVILAVCYKDQIYNWVKSQTRKENTGEKSEEEKENKE